jgi:hypothetical protein
MNTILGAIGFLAGAGLLVALAFVVSMDREMKEPKRPIRKGWLDEDAAVEEAKNIIAGIK